MNHHYLGGHVEEFLVVIADYFLDDNHKIVLVTPLLKTYWQPCVLCVTLEKHKFSSARGESNYFQITTSTIVS